MLTIRLNRCGKKNKAQFRFVLQEHTIAPGGRHIEVLGSYDPHSKKTVLKEEKIKYWISKGAQASDTVHNLLVVNKILEGAKRKVKLPAKVQKEEPKEEVKKVEETPTEETPAEEAKAEEVKEEKPVVAEAEVEKKEEVKAEEVKEEKTEEVKETEAPKAE